MPPVDSPYIAGNWIGNDVFDKGVGSPDITSAPDRTLEFRRYYYAAVTWTDHVLGKALDRLQEMSSVVSDKTITVFHSDHGYQLGELNKWSKKTNTEWATHVPLLIRVPWLKSSVGKRTTALVELEDVYRTLADLAGLSPHAQSSVQGGSLVPLFDSPGSPPAAMIKPAFSQIVVRCKCGIYTCHMSPADRQCNALNQSNYGGQSSGSGCNVFPGPENRSDPRSTCSTCTARYRSGSTKVEPSKCGWSGTECGGNACAAVPENQFDYMGYTMRLPTLRFTAWITWDTSMNATDWTQPIEYELYNATGDDGRDFDFAGYSFSLANRPENKGLVVTLQAQLRANVMEWP